MENEEHAAWAIALGRDPLLTPTARFVLVYLGHRAQAGVVVSKAPEIARDLALSNRTVHGALAELITKGVISRRPQNRIGRWREYRLLTSTREAA